MSELCPFCNFSRQYNLISWRHLDASCRSQSGNVSAKPNIRLEYWLILAFHMIYACFGPETTLKPILRFYLMRNGTKSSPSQHNCLRSGKKVYLSLISPSITPWITWFQYDRNYKVNNDKELRGNSESKSLWGKFDFKISYSLVKQLKWTVNWRIVCQLTVSSGNQNMPDMTSGIWRCILIFCQESRISCQLHWRP